MVPLPPAPAGSGDMSLTPRAPSPSRTRIAFVLASSAVCMAIAGATFWREDMRYSLPTPRPEGLVQAPLGSELSLRALLPAEAVPRARRPTVLHFFNPGCS